MPQSQWSTLVLIALMVVAFYFLILRPQKKRQQAQQQTMNQLVPGTRVLLGSGLFGTIVSVGEKQAVLEISPGVELTVVKPAIARIVTESDEDAPEEDDDFDVSDDPRDDTYAPQPYSAEPTAADASSPFAPPATEPATPDPERKTS